MTFLRTKSGILVVLLIAVFAFLYFFTGAFGGTFIGLTLNSNKSLQDGLVAHYTFDNKNMDLSSSTAEVLDSSSNSNTGDMRNFVVSFSGAEAESLPNASTSIIRQSCSGYSRCYTSLNAWEDANEGDITESGSDVVAIARIEGTWSSADTTYVNFGGWTVDEDNYLVIYTTDEARHGGYWNTNAYRIEVTSDGGNTTLFNLPDYSLLEGVQVGMTAGDDFATAISGDDGLRVIGNLVRGVSGFETYGSSRGIYTAPAAGTYSYIINNIVHGYVTGSGGPNYGIQRGGGASGSYNTIIYNNTVASTTYAFLNSWMTVVLKNNVCFENDGECYAAENWGTANHTKNAGPTTTFPTGDWVDITGETSGDLFVDYTNLDFRLKAGSALIATGTSLARDDYFSFDYDIEYETRGVSWDVGADQYDGGAPTFAGDGGPTRGVLGQGMEFDGVDDYLDFGNMSEFDLSSTDSTIAAWFKTSMDVPPEAAIIIEKINTDTAGFGLYFTNSGGTPDSLTFRHNTASDDGIASSTSWVPGEWVHAVGVTDTASTEVRLYVNGELVDSDSYTGALVNRGESLTVGLTEDGNSPYDGEMDDVRIYNRALSASEISRLYGLGATTKINKTLDTNPDLKDGLVGHWTFDGGDLTDKVYDISGQGNHGDLTGFSSTTTVPGILGQALDFGGSNDYVLVPDDASMRISNFTNAAWVKFNSLPPSGKWALLIGNVSGNSWQRYSIGWSRNSNKFSSTIDPDWANDTVSIVYIPELNTWYHIASTFDDPTQDYRLYLNGVEVAQETIDGSSDLTAGGALRLGGDGTNPNGNYLDAALDDVRIYDRPLSADEISRLYQLGATTKINKTITTNPDLKDGLVGHWTFDGPDTDWASTTAEIRDISGSNAHGDATNVAVGDSKIGKIGQALKFALSSDDEVNITQNSSINDLETLTIAAWIKLDTYGQGPQGAIIGKSPNGFNMYAQSSGQGLRFNALRWDTNGDWRSPTDSILTGEWYHVVITYDYGTTSNDPLMYINGESVTVTQATGPAGSKSAETDDLSIGNTNALSKDFDGLIDDVRIYNRVLSQAEITHLYQLGQ